MLPTSTTKAPPSGVFNSATLTKGNLFFPTILGQHYYAPTMGANYHKTYSIKIHKNISEWCFSLPLRAPTWHPNMTPPNT